MGSFMFCRVRLKTCGSYVFRESELQGDEVLSMMIRSSLLAGVAVVLVTVPTGAEAQRFGTGADGSAIETRIWLDRGLDPVFRPGDRARVYYRASEDAYVALFHLDTDGVLRLIFPSSPDVPHQVRGGRDYRVLFGEATDWNVDGAPGVGYFFALASTTPFQFGSSNPTLEMDDWVQLASSGERMHGDPYVTLDLVVQSMAPDRGDGSLAVDLTAYHVGQSYSYPRFLCYTCHAAEPVEDWNPYLQACQDYRVVIYNDPYFYPATRYRNDRVVYPLPPEPGQPQFAFKERVSGESGAPLVQGRGGSTGIRPVSVPSGQLPGAGPSGTTGRQGTGAAAQTTVIQPNVEIGEGSNARPVLQRRSSDQVDPPPR
jgi:hypothetical protein